jgi:hypothetical protein
MFPIKAHRLIPSDKQTGAIKRTITLFYRGWRELSRGFLLIRAKFRIAKILENLGAFFAPQKTGLCGGSAACAAAPRPSNPLRG